MRRIQLSLILCLACFVSILYASDDKKNAKDDLNGIAKGYEECTQDKTCKWKEPEKKGERYKRDPKAQCPKKAPEGATECKCAVVAEFEPKKEEREKAEKDEY